VLSDNASADLKNKSAPDLAIDASHNVLETEDRALEKKLCIIIIPAMLVASLLVQLSDLFVSLQRIAFGMPTHELGHATAAWFWQHC
jgi:hypothetical protein